MVDPFDVLDTLGNILRIEHIKSFCMCLEFSKIIKVSRSIAALDSFEQDDATSPISDRKQVPRAIKADR